MFEDQITITCRAGKGGDGAIAWRRESHIPKGGPYGGNGGHGGSIIIKSNPQLYSLHNFRHQRYLSAEKGQNGGSQNKRGRQGKDLILQVPCGTLIRDKKSGTLLCDLIDPDKQYLLCNGGKGGKGNTYYKTPTNQAPEKCGRGIPGEIKEIELELKLITDVGLLGFPNSGKSTLFSKLTKQQAKISSYPFTTLNPHLGFMEFDDFSRICLADIPGMDPRVHSNKMLGFSYLKHVERSHLLIYIIDLSGEEGRDPIDDFLKLRFEIKNYSLALFNKPFLVLLNKIDKGSTYLSSFKKRYPFPPHTLFVISALQNIGFSPLIERLRNLQIC